MKMIQFCFFKFSWKIPFVLLYSKWFTLNVINATDVVAVQEDFISSSSCDESCFEQSISCFVYRFRGSGGCIDNIEYKPSLFNKTKGIFQDS